MRKLFALVIHKAGWIMESVLWPLRAPFCRIFLRKESDQGMTIGITTFKARYKHCFKPLLRKLAILFPGSRIIVIANGDVDQVAQEEYLGEIRRFVSRFGNVSLISFREPRGLSFLWNTIMEHSKTPAVLILNDDLRVKGSFRRFVMTSGLADSRIATINNSWSHFVISTGVTDRVGLFDEGLTEVGGEDDDYLARLAYAGEEAGNYMTRTISRKKPYRGRPPRINSYGRDIGAQRGGYSTANSVYLENKWETGTGPEGGGVLVRQRNNTYWKLRPGHDIMKGRD